MIIQNKKIEQLISELEQLWKESEKEKEKSIDDSPYIYFKGKEVGATQAYLKVLDFFKKV